MGLRFRRSVRLFPGVRLNFSRSGISTTLGVRGAGATIGPRGTYANVGIPGSGLSYRTKVSPGAASHGSLQPARPLAHSVPVIEPLQARNEQQIHSAPVSTMTSAGLGELKRLINEAALRRIELIHTVQADEAVLERAERKLALARAFIIRLFTQSMVPRLATDAGDARNKLEDTQADLDGCYVDIDFGLDDAATGTFAAMSRSFGALRSCQRIWDITSTAQTDRIKERTTATQRIARSPVRLEFSQVDIVRSKYQTMCFGTVSGLEVHLYPGFVLTRERGSDFALIEWKDATIQFAPSRFIEEETVPTDSQIVGQTWAKANKDGSPDRRFSNNYQIPIAKYGELWFKSPTGLLEAYMISDCAKAENFASAVAHHQGALSQLDSHPEQPAPMEVPHEENEEPAAALTPTYEQLPPPSRMYADWIVLVLLAVALLYAGYWLWTNGSALPSSPRQAAVTELNSKATPARLVEPQAMVRAEVYVKGRVVNVRSSPSASARIVKKAPAGTRFSVFGTKGRWTQVGENQPIGWVLSSLLGREP